MTSSARAVAGGLALAALLLPASAHAAELAPLKPCYVSPPGGMPETVALQGSGFTPGAAVDIAVDGAMAAQNVFVEADGSFGRDGGGVPAPHQDAGERSFTVTASEQANPANTATATAQVVALRVRIVPADAAPRRRVRFSGAGFTGRGAVFGHYTYRDQLRRTVRFGRPSGPCGSFAATRRLIPVPKPRLGRWRLQVDQSRRYRPEPADAVWYSLEIDVFRRPG
jgi:hypothetical protein